MQTAIILIFCFGIWDMKIHNINQVEFSITNYGKFGEICCWPKGSGNNYIFGAGLWFGTVDSMSDDTLVTIGYGPQGGETEFAPGLHSQDPNAAEVIIYMYPSPWPAPPETFPMAPQEPVSDQDSWCCFNDCDNAYHMPGDTRPIGIEVYQTVYAWVDSEVQAIIFFTHELRNVLGQHLKNCYLGICADCDIGNETVAGNDICGVIVGRWYVINGESLWVDNLAYQWQEQPEPGWQEFPGVMGFDLLQTPFDLQPGQDKDNDGILDQYERDSAYYVNNLPIDKWDVDNDYVPDWRDASENPQYGLTALKRFTLNLEPNKDPERYLTMAGYNFKTGQYEPFDTVPPLPDDQRFLMSSGPFDLMPDSSATFVFAIMFANWKNLYQTPDTALVLIDKWAEYYYDMFWLLYTDVKENFALQNFDASLTVRPNPSVKNTTISFALQKSGLVSLKLYNLAGQLVKEVLNGYRPAGNYDINFKTDGPSQGLYFLVLETPAGKSSRSIILLR